MKKILFLTFLLSISFFACDDDSDGNSANFEKIDILTGLTLTDENGQPLGLWNVPNENPAGLRLFPNPSGDVLTFSNAQQSIARVCIVPVDCAADNSPDIATESLNISYSQSAIENKALLDISLPTPGTNISLNLSDVPAGFYKAFAKMELGEINWINFYRIESNTTPAMAIDELDNLCN